MDMIMKKPRCHKEFFPRQAGHLHCVAPILSREDLDGFEKLAQVIFLTKKFQTSISSSVRFSGSSQIIWVAADLMGSCRKLKDPLDSMQGHVISKRLP